MESYLNQQNRFGDFTDAEADVIVRTASAVAERLAGNGGYKVDILMKSGWQVRVRRLGLPKEDIKDDVYEISTSRGILGVYPNIYALAIAMCGWKDKAGIGYKGWRERI